MSEPVVITGLGTCSPFGKGTHAFTKGLREGRSCARKMDLSEQEKRFASVACMVPDDVFEGVPSEFKRLSRADQMATLAVTEAAATAQFAWNECSSDRIGVFYGVPSSTEQAEKLHATIVERGPRMVSPLAFENSTGMAGPGTMAMTFGITGPTIPLPGGGASGIQGIHLALALLRSTVIDVAIVVSTEEIAPLYLRSLHYLRMLARRHGEASTMSRPFDAGRNGIVPGEGSAAVLLERLADARSRGQKPIVELCGTVLAHAGRAGSGAGTVRARGTPDANLSNVLERTMRLAMTRAQDAPTNIDYVAACANSSHHLDDAEAEAIGRLRLCAPISSIASMIGDTGASSGLLNLVGCAVAVKDGCVPPTVNFSKRECSHNLDIETHPRTASIHVALANAYSIGGACGSTVIHSIDE